jgi:hypothetical protein
MDDMNWGNQPRYHDQRGSGLPGDATRPIPAKPGLSSHFAKDRRRALRWSAGIVAAVVLAAGGAIAGMDLAGSGSSPAGFTLGASSAAGSAAAGSAAAGSAVGGQAAALNTALSSAGAATPGTAAASPAAHARAGQFIRALRRLRGVHGEFTVRKKGGGFMEIAFERGTIVATSSTAVTVRAPDGTTWTWTLTSDTIVRKNGAKSTAASLATGDLVFVGGQETGAVRDARLIVAPVRRTASGSQGSAQSPSPSTSSS